MEVRDRFTFLQSSTEYSTATAEASYIKRPNTRPPSKAALLIKAFYMMTKSLQLRLALMMHRSQVFNSLK